jgi:hypothetical protein
MSPIEIATGVSSSYATRWHRVFHWFMRVAVATYVLALPLNLTSNPQTVESSARSEQVPITYFGLHIHDPIKTPWPDVQFGTLRLWDTSTRWRELEPSPGHYDFTRLDALVDIAERRGVQPILGLGLPPTWASQRPNEGPKWRPGSAAPPSDMQQWRDYVHTVVSRYKGRIAAYEVWNEANNPDFFTGDRRTLLELTKEASAIIRRDDSQALIISPNFTGKNTALRWLDDFLQDGGADYVDVIGYHFYVFPEPPEAILPLAKKVHEVMNRHHVDKPIWNTEISWLQKNTVPTGQDAAYVFRSFIVGWAAGIDRFYWYAWDEHSNISIELTDKSNRVDTSAVSGWKRATEWLLGQFVGKCEADANGTWACHVNGSAGDSYIVWNPSGPAQYTVDSQSRWTVTPLMGNPNGVSGNSVTVGFDPVKITHAP